MTTEQGPTAAVVYCRDDREMACLVTGANPTCPEERC